MTNISVWLRMFRPPLQQAYPPGEEPDAGEEEDEAFTDLLILADQRQQRRPHSESPGTTAPAARR